MADRQRQRIGGVRGSRHGIQPQHARDHRSDLRLVGGTVSRDRRLDLARCVQSDRETMLGTQRQRDAARLRGAHHGAEVVLREDALDRHRCRGVLGEHEPDALRHREQPFGERHLRRRLDDADIHESGPPVRRDIDDADAATGQSRVDTEHAHASHASGDSRTFVRDSPRAGPVSIRASRYSTIDQSSLSSSACTDAGMSKLLKMFCTSSLSSSASISRNTLRAVSASISTWMVGTNSASAES